MFDPTKSDFWSIDQSLSLYSPDSHHSQEVPTTTLSFCDELNNIHSPQAEETPTVNDAKDKLKHCIKKRRRLNGLSDEFPVSNDSDSKGSLNTLTPLDKDRKERRKASNRRAATKCREKKKQAADQLHKDHDKIVEENADLRSSVLKLESQLKECKMQMQKHLSICNMAFDETSSINTRTIPSSPDVSSNSFEELEDLEDLNIEEIEQLLLAKV